MSAIKHFLIFLFDRNSDVARLFGKRVKYTLVENPLHHLLIEHSKGELHFSKSTQEIANWAQQVKSTLFPLQQKRRNANNLHVDHC